MLNRSDIETICVSRNSPKVMREKLIERESCNGWPNQETWIANLWLSNEQGTSEHAYDVCDPAHGRRRYENGDILKAYVEELCGSALSRATMMADMLSCSLARVDWACVADAFAER